MTEEDENRALFASAIAHHQAGRAAEAMRDYKALLARNPRVAPALNNLGMLLDAAGRYREAEQCFWDALAIRPEYPAALNNLGAVLRVLRQPDQAIACFHQALALEPENVNALVNLADLQRQLGRRAEAMDAYARARRLRPDDYRIHKGLGHLLVEQDQPEEAIAAFATAVRLNPDSPETHAALLKELQLACDWRAMADEERTVLGHVRARRPGVDAFLTLSITGATAADQRLYAEVVAPVRKAEPPARFSKAGEKIRIAYVSGDYRRHPIPMLIAATIELHDRGQFDVIGYSIGEGDDSDIRQRIAGAFDRFEDVDKVSDEDVAARLVDDRIDILIDVSGYTRFARPGILAFKPAPLIVNYLAYPGTMGAPYVDYIIADRDLIADDQQQFYTEKVVYLPDSYQANDNTRPIAAATPSRAAWGLPDDAFVFCGFTRPSKITPAVFDVWMELLRAVPGSVLWLLDMNAAAVTNLRREAQFRNVDPGRLVFAPFVPSPENLARLRHADLFLDTLPYNAHTTMSDALWSGLPAITCRGNTFAGRVGASLLRAAGLPELITDKLSDYAQLALALARDPEWLDALFTKLSNPKALPLFQSLRYTRNLEKAYQRMAELHRAGRAPESFSV